jgi:hypothetical protein
MRVRIIIMHKTSPRWEAGATPSPQLVARVGAMIGDLAKQKRLLAGEGLRASSQGVRLRFSGGVRTIVRGPFAGEHELPSGFSIVRAKSIDEAIDWATRQAAALGDVEIDIRPVTEAWDIGMVPAPADVATRRYMVLRKATPGTESGATPSPPERSALARLIEETTKSGVHLVTETMRPSRKGRRYINSKDGVSVFDGPFAETKELLAGYIIVSAESIDDVDQLARRYLGVVEAGEVDVRELEP